MKIHITIQNTTNGETVYKASLASVDSAIEHLGTFIRAVTGGCRCRTCGEPHDGGGAYCCAECDRGEIIY